MNRKGFTMIELLASIGIIMLLASLILFGLNAARQRARSLEARRMSEQIQLAWSAYLADYHEFPFEGGGNSVTLESDIIMQTLRRRHEDDSSEVAEYRSYNRRGYTYFDIHHLSEGVRDPWGNFYQIAFDMNGNGTVTVPTEDGAEEQIRQSVAVWSMGRDGESGTRADVYSWRTD